METDFNIWLIKEIETRGWSNSELARRAGVVPSTISMVLSGQNRPGFDFCVKVARALQMPPEMILRRAGLLPSIPNSVEEEAEAMGILRGLPNSARRTVMQMLRGVARASDLPTGSDLQVRYIADEPNDYSSEPDYDPDTRRMLQEIAEMLTQISPEKREEITRKYLTLLEVERALEAAEPRPIKEVKTATEE